MNLFGLDVKGAGRGAIAREDLKVGDTALEIPVSIIISSELLHESDMVTYCFTKLYLVADLLPALLYLHAINKLYLEGSFLFLEKLMGFLRRQCFSCGA